MKKYLLLLLIALGSFVNVQAQKFALIDMEYIMRNIPAYERAGEQLNQISKKWQEREEKNQVNIMSQKQSEQNTCRKDGDWPL